MKKLNFQWKAGNWIASKVLSWGYLLLSSLTLSLTAPSYRKVYWSPWFGVCSKARLNLNLHKITEHSGNKMLYFCLKSTVGKKNSLFTACEKLRACSPRKSRVKAEWAASRGQMRGSATVWSNKTRGLCWEVHTTEGLPAETTTLFGVMGIFLVSNVTFSSKK